MPDRLLDNPRHWRAREEEIRVLTELMRNPETRRRMLKVADEYARLAELAEQRAKEKKRSGRASEIQSGNRFGLAGEIDE